MDLRLYLAQRISALIMVPLVLGHLGTMIYAIQGGLSAEEILSRTRGSAFWAGFYGLFVVSVAVHGAIGIRTIAFEWLKLRNVSLTLVFWLVFFVLLTTGFHAIRGVIL